MQRIIYVKDPLHSLVNGGAPAPLTVVCREERNRQHDRHLKDSVHSVQREKLKGRVDRGIEDHPEHLRLESAAVGPECHNAQARDTAPITREGDQTNEDHQQRLDP